MKMYKLESALHAKDKYSRSENLVIQPAALELIERILRGAPQWHHSVIIALVGRSSSVCSERGGVHCEHARCPVSHISRALLVLRNARARRQCRARACTRAARHRGVVVRVCGVAIACARLSHAHDAMAYSTRVRIVRTGSMVPIVVCRAMFCLSGSICIGHSARLALCWCSSSFFA